MSREITDVITKVIEQIPQDFAGREETIKKIEKIGIDSFYKSPEIRWESWGELGLALEKSLKNINTDWTIKISKIMHDKED